MKDLSQGKLEILAMHPLKKNFYDFNVFLDKDGLNEIGLPPMRKQLTNLILAESKESTVSPSKFTVDEISLLINGKLNIGNIILKLSKHPFIKEKAAYYLVMEIINEYCQEHLEINNDKSLKLARNKFEEWDAEINKGYELLFYKVKNLLFNMHRIHHEKSDPLVAQENINSTKYYAKRKEIENEAINCLLLEAIKADLPTKIEPEDKSEIKDGLESEAGRQKDYDDHKSEPEKSHINTTIDLICIQRLSNLAMTPVKTFSYASTYEIFASKDCIIPANTFKQVNTDIVIRPPKKSIALIMARPESQVHCGFSSTLTTVDWMSNKELMITIFNHNKTELKIFAGQAIARMVLTDRIYPDIMSTNYQAIPNPSTGKSDFTILQKQRKDLY